MVEHHPVVSLVLYIVGFLALVLVLLVILQRRARPRVEVATAASVAADDPGYRQLADEYRRLSEGTATAQARTDQRLEEIAAQLGQVREQLDSVQRILKDVE